MARSKTNTTRSSRQDVAAAVPKTKNGKITSQKKKPKIISDADNEVAQRQLSEHLDSRELLHVLTQVKNGKFSVRMPIDQVGLSGKICDTLNEIISLNEKMMMEFTRAGNTIGKQGKLNQRIELPNARGSWRTGVESLNILISDLVHPTI